MLARSETSVSRRPFLSELVPSDEMTSLVISRHVWPRSSVCSTVPESPTAHAVLSSSESYSSPECVFSWFIESPCRCACSV